MSMGKVPKVSFKDKPWGSNIGAPIDEDIAQFIVDLNDSGLTTHTSCSGHYGKTWADGKTRTSYRGWVRFSRRLNGDEKLEVSHLASLNGLVDSKFSEEGSRTFFEFEAPWYSRRK